MIVAVNPDLSVRWIHEDTSIKEQGPYVLDPCVMVVQKNLYLLTGPKDGYEYINMWNPETQEIYVVRGNPLEVPHEQITKQTHSGVAEVSDDNLTNMDLLMMILDNQQKIMTHLGIK